MTAAKWLILGIGLVGALLLSWYQYFRREPQGRGRAALSALRSASLILILLLLIDPSFQSAPTAARSRVILDSSLSMHLNGEAEWKSAELAAQQAAKGTQVIRAGSDSETRLLPALQAAAETGARKVVLFTDAAFDDAAEISRWLPSLGLDVDVREAGGKAKANRAISDVDAPSWAESGKPLTMRVSIAAIETDPAATVIVRQNGNEVARANGSGTIDLNFNAKGPPEGGLVRYDIAFEQKDAIPDDDVRSAYVFISDKPAGVAIVSFDPDWEPRFLHPVLAEALGLPVRTFLRTPAGIYFRAGNGGEAGGKVDEAIVRRAVSEADLLVLHGFSANVPDWAKQSANTARHSIVFLDSDGVDADWYVSGDVPSSPIASLLAGMDVSELPPLTSLQSTSLDYAWAALTGGRTPRGGNAPLVVAVTTEGRRSALALGTGYWRWSFRGGNARDAYVRLWGALAGWIVQGDAQVAASAIRPVQRTIPRGAPVRFVAPGVIADSLVLLTNGKRSTLQLQQDTATGAPLPAGHYNYDIRAFAGGKEIASARGPLTVESYSPEFIRRRADLSIFKSGVAALQRPDKGAGKPLHSYSWLYVLLVALLAGEWILRRRWGLR
ncbi:MAG TPA: hypothetical protein VM100_01330 [Longimicrobiales bacterium]|nr:hypothetical protein [Longimicrobiales bacterium]